MFLVYRLTLHFKCSLALLESLGWVAPPRRAAMSSATTTHKGRFVYNSGGWKRKSSWAVKRHRWAPNRPIAAALMRAKGELPRVLDEDDINIVPGTAVVLTGSATSQWRVLNASWKQLRRATGRLPIDDFKIAERRRRIDDSSVVDAQRCFAAPDYFAQMTRRPCQLHSASTTQSGGRSASGMAPPRGAVDLDMSSSSIGHRSVQGVSCAAAIDAVHRASAAEEAVPAASSVSGLLGEDGAAIGAFFPFPRALQSLVNSTLLCVLLFL